MVTESRRCDGPGERPASSHTPRGASQDDSGAGGAGDARETGVGCAFYDGDSEVFRHALDPPDVSYQAPHHVLPPWRTGLDPGEGPSRTHDPSPSFPPPRADDQAREDFDLPDAFFNIAAPAPSSASAPQAYWSGALEGLGLDVPSRLQDEQLPPNSSDLAQDMGFLAPAPFARIPLQSSEALHNVPPYLWWSMFGAADTNLDASHFCPDQHAWFGDPAGSGDLINHHPHTEFGLDVPLQDLLGPEPAFADVPFSSREDVNQPSGQHALDAFSSTPPSKPDTLILTPSSRLSQRHPSSELTTLRSTPQSDKSNKSAPLTFQFIAEQPHADADETWQDRSRGLSQTHGPTSRKKAPGALNRLPKYGPFKTDQSSSFSKFHTGSIRKKFTEQGRQEVAQNRKNGACFPCQWWKRTCARTRSDDCCKACTIRTSPLQALCFRLDLRDCGFFRTESAIQLAPLRTTFDWTSPVTIQLELTMPTIPGAPSLKVDCRPFIPIETDMTGDWIRGEDVGARVEVPTYAAVDLNALAAQTRRSAKGTGQAFVESMKYTGSAPITTRIIEAAFDYASTHPKSLVSDALDLWSGSRMCARDRSLVGETLGQEAVNDDNSAMAGVVPIPPTLDYQCDMMTFRWMQEVAKNLVKALWSRLQPRKKADWYEVFLTVFIMMNNVEFVYGIAAELRASYMLHAAVLGTRVHRTISDWLEKWNFSAEHLLQVYSSFFKAGLPFDETALRKARALAASITAAEGTTDRDINTLHEFNATCKGCIPQNVCDLPPPADDYNFELRWARRMFEQQGKG